MSYVRKIRIEYYKVVCKNIEDEANTPDRDFDLNLWIERVDNIRLEERTFTYYQEKARLDKLSYDDVNDFWYLKFLRLRETNIPSKAKIDQEAEPLSLDDDEYIGEDASALYDENLGVLMLQRNRHSLGIKGIEEYLNSVWNSENEKIYLRPIAPLDIHNKVRNAYEYRKMTIRFADIQNNNLSADDRKPLKKIFSALGSYNAINAEITVTMGYNKNESLHKDTVKDTLDEILSNSGVVSKAELGLKECDDTTTEVIDIFEDKMHNFIFVNLEKRESISCEYMALRMAEKFNNSKEDIISSLRM